MKKPIKIKYQISTSTYINNLKKFNCRTRDETCIFLLQNPKEK